MPPMDVGCRGPWRREVLSAARNVRRIVPLGPMRVKQMPRHSDYVTPDDDRLFGPVGAEEPGCRIGRCRWG